MTKIEYEYLETMIYAMKSIVDELKKLNKTLDELNEDLRKDFKKEEE